jgi:threonine aldolase
MKPIDLRSDTATLPTEGMRRAMAAAELGDDMLGEDPTVNALERRVAELTGKEAAMFVPSGTMSNQIALRLHLRPGDEVMCDATAHIYLYEGGGPAALSGAMCQTIAAARGALDVDDFRGRVRPNNIHCPRTRLVALENTHNRGNGAVLPLANVHRIATWTRENKLAFHLDGARLWNASVKTGVPIGEWCRPFDTVSLCFSKGMGCPVGSILVGPKDLMSEARRLRKLLGGAMRQAGVLAAAASYALDHHFDRLAEDHAHAQLVAKALEETPGFRVRAADFETNLLWIPVEPQLGTPVEIAARFRERGVLVGAYGADMIRMCTHLGVTRADVDRIVAAIRQIGAERAAA